MNGGVHDFVVINTVKDGSKLPTGHGGGDSIVNVTGQIFPNLSEQSQFSRILEIGSLDICGSMRTYDFVGTGQKWLDMIGNPYYLGIDITEGKGVDLVMDAHAIAFKDHSFDLVLCLEMLEHDTDPQKTLNEAYRVLEKGGLFLCSTVDQDHEEHGSGPDGFYRHLTEGELLDWTKKAGFKSIELVHKETSLYLTATK